MVVYTYNSCILEAVARRLEVQGYLCLHIKFKASLQCLRSCQEERKEEGRKRGIKEGNS